MSQELEADPNTAKGSIFHGKVDAKDSLIVGGNLQLTVQGVALAEIDELARRIVAALKAAGPVSIIGGENELTVLAVDSEPQVVMSPEQQQALAARSTDDLESYLAALVMHRDFAPWDRHYVPLAASAERPAAPQAWGGQAPLEFCALERRGEGPGGRLERISIPDIAAAVRDYPQFVLLGEPGGGKSTALRKVALEAARVRLRDETAPVPLFVELSGHRGTESPHDFLAGRWRARLGEGWSEALRQRRVLLLLDAINEMPRAGRVDRIADWRAFVRQWDGLRMVFSCRTLDYQNPLGLQQVEIAPLDDSRIQDFLARRLPSYAYELWAALRRHAHQLLELARNPFMLAAVTYVYAQAPDEGLPANRGRLMRELVAGLLAREAQRNHADWMGAEALAAALSGLAWSFQRWGEGTSLPAGELMAMIPRQVVARGRLVEIQPETALRLACSANLLEENLEGHQVRFYHHLMQEYFAARELVRRFEAKEDLRPLWRVPWRESEMPEPEGVGEWDPLPPPPGAGWEETTIVAAGLAEDPAALVDAIRSHNLVLAGRCLNEGGVEGSDGLREGVRDELLGRLGDRQAHLRSRIAAGHVLGRLADPRFEEQERERVAYILPPLVPAPAGEYRIGSTRWDRGAWKDERPRHKVQLEAFSVGKYPVTVAEYRCFVAAGGYRSERYWRSEAARAWLRGEEVEGGSALDSLLEQRQLLMDSERPLAHWAKERSWTPQTLENWQTLTAMSEEEAREALRPIYADRSREQPAWWDDGAYTGANQPVVGVTWFEAGAYTFWLSEISGRPFRLPTEAEWEVAVRGGAARRYPWGSRFQSGRANTVEGRVLRTTPVGAYPQGTGPGDLADGAGNVWEWTSSLFKPYPYRPDDGREEAEIAGRRGLRGGSWGYNRRNARCASRSSNNPDKYSYVIGFRIVSPGSRLAES